MWLSGASPHHATSERRTGRHAWARKIDSLRKPRRLGAVKQRKHASRKNTNKQATTRSTREREKTHDSKHDKIHQPHAAGVCAGSHPLLERRHSVIGLHLLPLHHLPQACGGRLPLLPDARHGSAGLPLGRRRPSRNALRVSNVPRTGGGSDILPNT